MNKFFLLPVVASLVLAACTSTHDSADAVKFTYARKPNPYYTVQEDDTLSSISSKYGMQEEELIRMNDFAMPYDLIPGQKIIIYPKTKSDSKKVSQKFVSDDVEVESAEPNLETHSEEPIKEGLVLNPEDKAHQADVPAGQEEVNKDSGRSEETHQDDEASASKAKAGGYRWPVKGKVTKKIDTDAGGKLSGGIDIAAPEGTPVYATKSGVVVKSDVDVKGLGKTIIVKHDDGTMSVYSHLKSCMVKGGQKIDSETVIGRVGKTGGVKKPMLHFQLRGSDKAYIDPLKKLS